jgi:hypothetical protein
MLAASLTRQKSLQHLTDLRQCSERGKSVKTCGLEEPETLPSSDLDPGAVIRLANGEMKQA